jgi:acetoin utilization protein AcuC
MTSLTIAYTPEYLDWQLGADHPTDPRRSQISTTLMAEWSKASGVAIRWISPELDWPAVEREAGRVHDARYVQGVRAGVCNEWTGRQVRLGEVAALMFQGTVDLVKQLKADRANGVSGVYFNPQGAKHHAQRAAASGFCVLNDMAWAATDLTGDGLRVLYADWDAHHGDGVEALLIDNTDAVTASIHDATIFPGTGRSGHREDKRAYNWARPRSSGDTALTASMAEVLTIADEFTPDVILLACGADGLAGDPLSSLRYTLDGIESAATMLGAWCRAARTSILVGGAGGYQPLTETPKAWVTIITTLYEQLNGPDESHAAPTSDVSRRRPDERSQNCR